MSRVIILGAGRVGTVIADDLARDGELQVAVSDMRAESLKAAEVRVSGRITTIHADFSDADQLKRVIDPYDLVVGALASHIGFRTLSTVIDAGKNYCDISFMAEEAWNLDGIAKQNSVTAVFDCGVAPGLSNMLAGYGVNQLEECHNIEIYVGGLPRKPEWPFLYKAGYSPADVIEFYCRPARLVENGKVVVKEPLSEPELMEFSEVGTLEAFNTDGLRSMIEFVDVPNMKEKTLRYAGHAEAMRIFREAGLFSLDEIDVNGVKVKPRDLISELLFPKWTYMEGEEDLTALRVIVEGMKDGKKRRLSWDMIDFYDRESKSTSMSRVTALPCTAVARLILSGQFTLPGVIAPEVLAQHPGTLDYILKELESRNIHLTT